MYFAGIPIVLSDKPVVCKLCKCFASIILKDPEERMENSINFFKEYKKRFVDCSDIQNCRFKHWLFNLDCFISMISFQWTLPLWMNQ